MTKSMVNGLVSKQISGLDAQGERVRDGGMTLLGDAGALLDVYAIEVPGPGDHNAMARANWRLSIEREVRRLDKERGVAFMVTKGNMVKVAVGREDAGQKMEWMGPWKERGLRIEPKKKVTKRIDRLLRPHRAQCELDAGAVSMEVIIDPAQEKLLDGILHLDFGLVEACVKEMRPLLRTTKDASYLKKLAAVTKEYQDENAARLLVGSWLSSVNSKEVERFEKRRDEVLESKTFSVDIISPTHGAIKAAALVSHGLKKRTGHDLVVHKANVKSTLMGCRTWLIGITPYGGKDSARMNVQFATALPQFFTPGRMQTWVSDHLEDVTHAVVSGDRAGELAGYANSYMEEIELHEQDEGLNASLFSFYSVGEWFAHGLTQKDSVAYSQKLLATELQGLRWITYRDADEKIVKNFSINPKIPCSVYRQVLPLSVLRTAGYPIILRGERPMVWHEQSGCMVVSDSDYVEMLAAHGGADGDDKFVCVKVILSAGVTVAGVEMHKNETCWLVLRSPMGVGEWSLFRMSKEDEALGRSYMVAEKADDGETVIGWVKKDVIGTAFDPTGVVARTSEKPPVITEKNEAKLPTWTEYTLDVAIEEAIAAVGGEQAGFPVNVLGACAYATAGKHQMKEMPASMEGIIDAHTQGGVTDLVLKIQEWANTTVRNLHQWMADTGVMADKALWEKYNFKSKKGEPKLAEVQKGEGRFTKLLAHIDTKEGWAVGLVQKWAEKQVMATDGVFALLRQHVGECRLSLARYALQVLRRSVPKFEEVKDANGATLYQKLVESVVCFDPLAMHLAILVDRVKDGNKLTDALLWRSTKALRALMEALLAIKDGSYCLPANLARLEDAGQALFTAPHYGVKVIDITDVSYTGKSTASQMVAQTALRYLVDAVVCTKKGVAHAMVYLKDHPGRNWTIDLDTNRKMVEVVVQLQQDLVRQQG